MNSHRRVSPTAESLFQATREVPLLCWLAARPIIYDDRRWAPGAQSKPPRPAPGRHDDVLLDARIS